ncbi:MAG: hypothetical protein E7649_01000 [Ruminococcaceae bacterium]|nr:hypothetical protein [Oscillospiraceae bacterium]
MKACVIQPYYSFNKEDIESCFEGFLGLIDECDDSLDLIVLPEYSDVLAAVHGKKEFYGAVDKYNGVIMQKASELAVRCHAIVCVNASFYTELGVRNTTFVLDREGNIAGKYFKAHPAPSEVKTDSQGGNELDVEYSYLPEAPYVLEIEGMRLGFMTCYDFYFYENFARLARENVDVIIGCSHQRTDTHEALSIINRFLCYNTNAYLVRVAVSLGEDSDICGCSSIIAPDGKVLVDMKSRVGLGVCDIDVKDKYYKPAGFGGVLKSHYEYIEEGRRPWLYRNGGASVVPFEDVMKYPRLCAHRGFSAVCPENSMVALGSAVALGAEEIEFDIWSTSDGVLVSCHDDTLDRVSDGEGKIYEKTYAELMQLDFGVKHGEKFKGLRIATFEEILKKFSGRVVMNIHVKIWDYKFDDDKLCEIVALIRKYDCARHVYFMTTNDEMTAKARKYAPEIACCVGFDGNPDPLSMPRRAIALGAQKIQLFKPYFNAETVKLAHENGILCNVFWSDEPDEAREFFKMGIDTVLTNDYLRIYTALKDEFPIKKV